MLTFRVCNTWVRKEREVSQDDYFVECALVSFIVRSSIFSALHENFSRARCSQKSILLSKSKMHASPFAESIGHCCSFTKSIGYSPNTAITTDHFRCITFVEKMWPMGLMLVFLVSIVVTITEIFIVIGDNDRFRKELINHWMLIEEDRHGISLQKRQTVERGRMRDSELTSSSSDWDVSPMIRFDDGILAVAVNDTRAKMTRDNWKKARFDRSMLRIFSWNNIK